MHERMHSFENESKRGADIKPDDLEKRRRIDDGFLFKLFNLQNFLEINKRLNKENEKRDKFLGNIENKRKIMEKKEEFSQNMFKLFLFL